MSESTVLNAAWKSMAYPSVHGTCELSLPRSATRDQFTAVCTIKYAEDSSFRAGTSRTVSLIALRSAADGRVTAQSELGPGHMYMITINLAGHTFGGFYSSVHPADCGTLRPLETKSQWKAALGL